MKCVSVLVLFMAFFAGVCQAESGGDANAAITNAVIDGPLEFNIATVKRGKQLYTVHCVSCHGVDGRGDTEMREFLKTPPADLTDDQWIYGGSGEAVFAIIANGMSARDMPGFGEKLTDERVWQIVNYMKYLRGIRP